MSAADDLREIVAAAEAEGEDPWEFLVKGGLIRARMEYDRDFEAATLGVED